MGHLSQGEEEEEDGPAGASLGAHLYQVFLHPVVHKVDTNPGHFHLQPPPGPRCPPCKSARPETAPPITVFKQGLVNGLMRID